MDYIAVPATIAFGLFLAWLNAGHYSRRSLDPRVLHRTHSEERRPRSRPTR